MAGLFILPAAASAFAGEIFEREGAHDVPLPLIGVLRLVDEDVIGRLVELVAHPVAHSVREEQRLGMGDEIVEIDHALGALGFGIGASEGLAGAQRSEEHTSELQSLMRTSYAVFCLKKKQMNKRRH